MRVNITFGEGGVPDKNREAEQCIRKAFGGDDLGVLHVSLAYTSGVGYRVIEAKVTRMKGGAYKPGDKLPPPPPPEDYSDKVRDVLKGCGVQIA